jgi:putative inorganic carbon (hco3(-)) transporter
MTLELQAYLRRHSLTLYSLVGALFAGLAIGYAVPSLAGQSLYRLVMFVLALCVLFGLMVAKARKQILVAFLIFAIPLNLTFTPFGNPPWHEGGAPAIPVIFLYDFPLLILMGLWVVDPLLSKRPIRITLIEIVGLIMCCWGVLTLLTSRDAALTLMEVLRMLKLLVLGHVVANVVTSRRALMVVFLAFTGALLIQSVFSLLQYTIEFDLGGLGFTVGEVRRVSGTVGWPNTLGAFAASSLCLPIAIWIGAGLPRHRAILVGIIVVGAIPLAVSFSRGAWVALAISVIVMYLLNLKRRWVSVSGFVAQAIVLIALVLVAAFLLTEQISERSAEDTLSVRERLNDIAVRMTEANPLLGVGLNTFVESMPNYDPQNVRQYFAQPVHNIFLLVMAETGIVGLVLFVQLLLLVLRAAWIVTRYGDRFVSTTIIGVIGALIAVLVSNVWDVHLRTDVIYAMFWVLVGVVLGMRQMLTDEAATQPVVEMVRKDSIIGLGPTSG